MEKHPTRYVLHYVLVSLKHAPEHRALLVPIVIRKIESYLLQGAGSTWL